nr:MAG TPA: hypothetical protein [Caudoviricetes sp.]
MKLLSKVWTNSVQNLGQISPNFGCRFLYRQKPADFCTRIIR